MLFEWNKIKAHQNLLKHGVSFEEASTTFRDEMSIVINDPLHSERRKQICLDWILRK